MQPQIEQAVTSIKKQLSHPAAVGIILGSGLTPLVAAMEDTVTIGFADIPNFPVSSVAGHSGELVAGRLSNVDVLVMSGRIHFYEGYSMPQVCFPTKVLSGLGINTLIVTNAGGAINTDFAPGNIVLITDHINMMGDNPLRGDANFIDMTTAYDPDLMAIARKAAAAIPLDIKEGVYLAVSGPCYETPAEIRAMRTLGADVVGMSTVPEVIMANSLGIRVLGLSTITNMAAGITGTPLSHQEVLETNRQTAERFKQLICGFLNNWHSPSESN